jgi:hypothetical protein
MLLRATWVDRKVEITIPPGVLVVTAADPWIARSLVVAGLQGNADTFPVEAGGPLKVRSP